VYCPDWAGVHCVFESNGGAAATSAPVHITVLAPPPPSVKIASPYNGQTFLAPANIWICSATRYFPDAVASVQYFSGAASLGIVTNGPTFCLHWTNVPPGAYTLTATAKDVAGTNTVTSPAVQVTIRTNGPPIWRR
jgi:chitinase